jgi:hypothetical protein
MPNPTTPSAPQAPPGQAKVRPAPHEEPEFNNERDIPTESGGAGADGPSGGRGGGGEVDDEAVAGKESVAGEEDPGAALDELADQR